MNLKEFVRNVLSDLVDAVEETRAGSTRDLYLSSTGGERTVEFDIAVAAESSTSGKGKGGIKVFSFVEVGAELAGETKNSTVSRVKFGVHISNLTKVESATRLPRIPMNSNR